MQPGRSRYGDATGTVALRGCNRDGRATSIHFRNKVPEYSVKCDEKMS
jgi:hypothetical protein